ncbi:MAG: CHAP domain-containing protein [Acetobacteraceae bacterium]|nr:CHAP domain-containing protein [Acetobacteraceae bacterium]MCX7683729.1 CHAP domain-containing protein [Acetobacteraceae bacterium]
MAYTDNIVAFAAREEGTHWGSNPIRILEYFLAATGFPYTRQEALQVSWCTYFVMWVLTKAQVRPLPKVGRPPPENFSVARFIRSVDGRTATNKDGSHRHWGVYDAHSVALKRYAPKPGDLFYLPSFKDHVGIVEKVISGAKVETINGNSGPRPGEGTDPRLVPGIGGGFVHRKTLDLLDGSSAHSGAVWIEVPD